MKLTTKQQSILNHLFSLAETQLLSDLSKRSVEELRNCEVLDYIVNTVHLNVSKTLTLYAKDNMHELTTLKSVEGKQKTLDYFLSKLKVLITSSVYREQVKELDKRTIHEAMSGKLEDSIDSLFDIESSSSHKQDLTDEQTYLVNFIQDYARELKLYGLNHEDTKRTALSVFHEFLDTYNLA